MKSPPPSSDSPRPGESAGVAKGAAVAADEAAIAVSRADDGWVTFTITVPGRKQNVIDAGFLAELSQRLDALDAGPPPAGLVIRSGRPGSFFAGADLDRLQAILGASEAEIVAACDRGRRLFARLGRAAWPSVAVIDGVCLGGGLELALACDHRVVTDAPETALGFPEVKLGLLPGWGGTTRLPRLVGPGPALDLLASGETIDGLAAWRLGIADAWVPRDAAAAAARSVAARAPGGLGELRRRRERAPDLDPAEREFLEAVSGAVIHGRTAGHYPAPPAILETVLAGVGAPSAAAEAVEGRAFAALARSEVARQLVRVFRLGERNRRDSGVAGSAADGGPFVAPAVVGAGIMGAGIAAAHLRGGMSATLCDVQPEALDRGVPEILQEAAWDKSRRGPDPATVLRLSGRLRTATSVASLAGADLVIESVLERTDVKRAVLAEIEAIVGPDAVIATNTSTNPVTKLAEALRDPSRFCGMHFFNPVRRMMLVEVVRGPATSDATVARVVAHGKRLGKCPIVVRDSPGFLVNRMLMPYLHEAVEMLREGVDPRRVDRVARAFGMPMGPIELYDMIGLDTAFYAGLVLADAFGDRIESSPVIPAMVKSGRLGRKSGCGFYRYSGTGPKARIERVDEEVAGVIGPYALPPHAGGRADDRTIADRLLLPMVLEATLVLDEGIVRDPRDIDLAVIHALGFPPFRGGLLAWADSLGAAEVMRRLEALSGLGVRMHPTPGLESLARAGGRFTD